MNGYLAAFWFISSLLFFLACMAFFDGAILLGILSGLLASVLAFPIKVELENIEKEKRR